ncbi:recombinase family protein [Rhizobium leguminosarum]|uniref:recombinase family protein n=1 Tax=Rhizobium leguminosarum TaxID=384 RepID=UPI003F947181
MKRAVIYARYSTDLQTDKSVEDQISLCRDFAGRIGAVITNLYYDKAKSGASMFGRPGLADLMVAAEQNDFDIVITESTDRVSRDIADLAHVHKVLKFRNIQLQCVNGGLMDTVQIGMYGIVGQMQREEGARKVKRGMMGVVRSGRNAGGKAYGYRPVAGKPGELEIIEEEASVIRRVFDLYAAGVSPRAIAGILNRDRIPAPRGRQWNASTINGNGQRGNGILRNPIYAGRIVWNRVHMVKDPSTGRRVSRTNDEADLETVDAPHLRIIPQDLFDAVQLRKDDASKMGSKSPRSKRILSGLLRCGACEGGMTLVGADRNGRRIQCSTHRESSTCSNSRRYYLNRIEALVLSRLRSQFADTSIIEAYVSAYQDEQKRIRSSALRDRAGAARLLEEAKKEITEIVRMLSKGLIEEDEASELLGPLRQQRDKQQVLLESIEEPTNVIELQPKAVRRFRENIENLSAILAQGEEEPPPELLGPFRQLVAAVVVYPTENGQVYEIGIKGYLSSLIDTDLSVIKMVAEEGFEPPTQGL